MDRMYIIQWSVRIFCAYLSVGWSCRLIPFGGLVSKASLSSTLSFPIYSTGGLWRFSKVRTSLIEVEQQFAPVVLCSTIVYTRHPLDNCSFLDDLQSFGCLLSNWLCPALATTAMPFLNTRPARFLLANITCPVVPLPPPWTPPPPSATRPARFQS